MPGVLDWGCKTYPMSPWKGDEGSPSCRVTNCWKDHKRLVQCDPVQCDPVQRDAFNPKKTYWARFAWSQQISAIQAVWSTTKTGVWSSESSWTEDLLQVNFLPAFSMKWIVSSWPSTEDTLEKGKRYIQDLFNAAGLASAEEEAGDPKGGPFYLTGWSQRGRQGVSQWTSSGGKCRFSLKVCSSYRGMTLFNLPGLQVLERIIQSLYLEQWGFHSGFGMADHRYILHEAWVRPDNPDVLCRFGESVSLVRQCSWGYGVCRPLLRHVSVQPEEEFGSYCWQ